MCSSSTVDAEDTKKELHETIFKMIHEDTQGTNIQWWYNSLESDTWGIRRKD